MKPRDEYEPVLPLDAYQPSTFLTLSSPYCHGTSKKGRFDMRLLAAAAIALALIVPAAQAGTSNDGESAITATDLGMTGGSLGCAVPKWCRR